MKQRTARPNRSLDPRTADPRGVKLYKDWHWGIEPEHVIDWPDPDYPEGLLIECGRLVRLHFRLPQPPSGRSRHPRRRSDSMIQLSREAVNQSHVAYDPEHPDHRLYLMLPEGTRRILKRRFWDENPLSAQPLIYWARLAGGRHGRQDDYPGVRAKPVGVLTAIVYFTHKKDDGPSYYIHKMGELTCFFPVLCCDEQGRLWLAGGNYRCPTPGVTD